MIETECHLWGKDFNPSNACSLPAVIVRDCTAPGDIGTTGRYKNKATPYGACILVTPNTVPDSNRIVWMADFIDKYIELFRKSGATDIVYWIYWKGTQGNMEFNAEELKKIAKLNIPLCVDYIQITQQEYDTEPKIANRVRDGL